MDKNIFHLVENSTSGIDLLGIFYTEFVKYSNTDGNELGIVLTPHHIVDFMCKLVNVNKNSRVLDPTCGTGAFLVTAMSYMLKDAKNDKEIEKHIKQEQLYGIEKDEDVYDLAIINMIIRKDGKSNIKHANCFSEQEWIKNCRINTLLMNPPYSLSKKKKNGNETDESLCELNFLKNAMDYIEVNGFACIILPTSSAIGNKFPNTRELLFSKHTLLGVFSMPNDVFYPTAVNTCVML
jgi:type I restriction-modification system DNA methylase subunit